MTDRLNNVSRPSRRPTAAARLIDDIDALGTLTLLEVARMARLSAAQLEACRNGIRPLDHDEQLRLAAVAASLSPTLERRARALFAQAQAALRMNASLVQQHLTYPKEHFR